MTQTEIQTFAAKAVSVLLARYDAETAGRMIAAMAKKTEPGSEARRLQDAAFRAIALHVEG